MPLAENDSAPVLDRWLELPSPLRVLKVEESRECHPLDVKLSRSCSCDIRQKMGWQPGISMLTFRSLNRLFLSLCSDNDNSMKYGKAFYCCLNLIS